MRRPMSILFGVAALVAYDWTLRQWMLEWGTTLDEREASLPATRSLKM